MFLYKGIKEKKAGNSSRSSFLSLESLFINVNCNTSELLGFVWMYAMIFFTHNHTVSLPIGCIGAAPVLLNNVK